MEVHRHWPDIWLLRISHFSQFGLFVITLGSLYFVVLPIYQKTLLDEAIARKEIELKESDKLVKQSYEQLRKLVVEQFTFRVFVKCIVDFQDLEFTKDEKGKQGKLNYDASNCLLESEKDSSDLKLLRPNDQIVFLQNLKSVAAEIEQNRIIALKQYMELPSKAKSNPTLLKPPKYITRRLLENWEKTNKAFHLNPDAAGMDKLRFDAGVASAQLDVRSEHLDFAKQKLADMINLNWSNSN